MADAAFNGDADCVTALVQKRGHDPNKKDSEGDTPAWNAARENHVACLRALKGLGADMSAPGEYGWTPLFAAASAGHLDAVKFLHAECGCDPTTAPTSGAWRGTTPLRAAEKLGRSMNSSENYDDVAAYLRTAR